MRKSSKKASSKPVPATVAPAANVSSTAPAKPSKPAAATVRAERVAILAGHRATAAAVYNGDSLTVHHAASPKLAACLARIATPIQKASSGASPRDESLLRVIGSSNGNKPVAFDPVALGCDLGVLSRLASLGYIATDGKTATLTATGAERAALVAKRA